MKRMIGFFTALALLVSFSPALAAEVSDLFPAQTQYTGFSDVSDSAWYASAVKVCCETGLMTGTDSGFNPEGNLTLAEVITISARIYATLHGETVPAASEGAPWYEGAQNYLTDLGIWIQDDLTPNASRLYLIENLSSVVTTALLTPINSITSLPDEREECVLAFYNAGILTGADIYGTFHGYQDLTRAEAAAILARLVRPALRKTITLAEYSNSMFFLGVTKDTILMTINGKSITTGDYLQELENEIVYFYFMNEHYADSIEKQAIEDLYGYLKTETLYFLTNSVVYDSLVDQMGCETGDLPALLFPDPTASQLSAYFSENCIDLSGMFCDKEIICSTLEDAENCLKQLQADSTQFDALINTHLENYSGENRYWSESGRSFSGNGEAFDEALQSLAIGEISDVITAPPFYFIIQRIDPLTSSVYIRQYQSAATDAFVQSLVQAATVQFTPLYDSISAEAFYHYLYPNE